MRINNNKNCVLFSIRYTEIRNETIKGEKRGGLEERRDEMHVLVSAILN